MASAAPHTLQTTAQLAMHLRTLRRVRGFTQAQLGERIGVGQVRIADIEKNPGAVSLTQLLQLLHALDASLQLVEKPASPAEDLKALW